MVFFWQALNDETCKLYDRLNLRILFLHEVNYLEKPIFEMHELPEHLALRGHQVGFVQFPEGWGKAKIKSQGFKSEIQGRVVPQARITLYTPQLASGSLIGRLMTALTFGSEFRKVVDDFRPDVIVSFSVPTSGWQALRVAMQRKISYVFRALDVSHKIRKNLFSRLIFLAEKYVYKNATGVSANNPAMAKYCMSMGAEAKRISVDLPPIDLDHFSRASGHRTEIRNSLGLYENHQVILYMGSFFYFSGLPEFVREFAKSASSNQRLVLIGGGEQEGELRKLVADFALSEKVIFTGFVSFQDLPRYLSAADVAINTMHRSLVSNAAFPNKVIQYMASALPVVSTDLDGLRLTFGDLPGLKLVQSPAEAYTAVSDLLSQSNLRELGANNQEVVARIFSKEGAVAAFESLLVKTVGNNA
jgi:glycosyltransferase involved in cell wall biosynthesis